MPDQEVTGYTSTVYRKGDAVHRKAGPWTPAVHAFLQHLETLGVNLAPRVRGYAEDFEVLSYVPGAVPGLGNYSDVTEAGVRSAGSALRKIHDASRSFVLPEGVEWYHERCVQAGRTVICHNDLSPRNTVFRKGEPIAFIDWDFAGPEDPWWDLAHAVWQFAPLMHDAACRARGWHSKLPARARRARAFMDGYGLISADERAGVLRLVGQRIEATLGGIEQQADAGAAAARRLVADGVTSELRDNLAWLAGGMRLWHEPSEGGR